VRGHNCSDHNNTHPPHTKEREDDSKGKKLKEDQNIYKKVAFEQRPTGQRQGSHTRWGQLTSKERKGRN
jgi:hypothetical protein